MVYRPILDRLHAQGLDAVRCGSHQLQVPPVEDGPRWGTSVILRPDPEAGARIDLLAQQAAAAAGVGHWPTGAAVSAHLTVRALERHRRRIASGDGRRRRYEAALGAAARKSPPLRFALRGVALTPNGVLLGAVPVGCAADEFAALLARELGPDGWLEAARPRDLWYLTLVHFAAPCVDEALVEWVAARRDLELGTTTVDAAQLVIWRYNGRHVVPDPLTMFPLGG